MHSQLAVILPEFYRPVGAVARHKDIAVGVGRSEIQLPGGQIAHSVANSSLPLRRIFGAVLPRH